MLNIFVDTTHNRHRCQLENEDDDDNDDDLLDYIIESFFFPSFFFSIVGDQRREITSVDTIQNDFFFGLIDTDKQTS